MKLSRFRSIAIPALAALVLASAPAAYADGGYVDYAYAHVNDLDFGAVASYNYYTGEIFFEEGGDGDYFVPAPSFDVIATGVYDYDFGFYTGIFYSQND